MCSFLLLSNIDFHRLILSFLVRFRAHDRGKNAGAVIASFTSSITTLMYKKMFPLFLSLPFVGRLFDKNGNFKDWWSYESEFNFKDRSQCLVDQYSNYEVFGEYVSI